jgi:hypothetical protein
VNTVPLYPSSKVSDMAIEPYNAMLGSTELYHHSDMVEIMDNEALYNIASRNLVSRSPTYNGLEPDSRLCISDLVHQFDGQNSLRQGRYLTATVNFMGNLSTGEVEEEMASIGILEKVKMRRNLWRLNQRWRI